MTSDFQTIAVYLGSSGHARPVFRETARGLGTLIGESGKHLVYGGMDAGLMGDVALYALKAGGEVTGVIPEKIKDSERILEGLTETIMVNDLWDRKKRMFLMADAVVALPGGFGTMDESIEVLYWGNLGLHCKPLVLVNIEGYWDSLINYLQALPDFDERFLIVTDDINNIFTALKSWTPPPCPLESPPDHFPHFEDEITRATKEAILIDEPSIENTYYAICALGLKQLGKTDRPIGFLNTGGQFDDLLSWIEKAAEETFITQKCLKLYDVEADEISLRDTLKNQEAVVIDLHKEKWGPRRGES